MPWNGAGTFTRLYSWVADRVAGLDISSTRMDADTNDIVSSGLGNCLTRDGQGIATALLPMGGFRHTGVGNGQNRTDYAALGQLQDGLINWVVAGGTSDALTASYAPAITTLADGELFFIRAIAQNATTQPTLKVNALTAYTITKGGGQALAIGDINGNLQELILRYNLANTRFELLNPYPVSGFSTGDAKLTLKTSADTGWIMATDGTIGNASSGATYANANALALYTLLWTNVSNTYAPVTGGRGASAAADWAAQKPIALTKVLGRMLAVAGAGSGLTSRVLGQTGGAETQTLGTANLPAYTPSGAVGVAAPSQSDPSAFIGNAPSGGILSVYLSNNVGASSSGAVDSAGAGSNGAPAAVFTGNPQGGTSTAFSILPPFSSFNVMVKL